MSSAEMIVGALIEVEALLIAWAIYPMIFGRKSQRS
jgi:hypothetical protein